MNLSFLSRMFKSNSCLVRSVFSLHVTQNVWMVIVLFMLLIAPARDLSKGSCLVIDINLSTLGISQAIMHHLYVSHYCLFFWSFVWKFFIMGMTGDQEV